MLVGELLITNDDDAVDDAPITITQPKLYVTGSAGGNRTQLPPKAVRCAALAVQPGEPLLCKFHVAYKGDYRRSKTPKAGTVSATVVVPAQGDAAAMNFTAEPVPFDFNKSTHETWGDFALVNDWFETGDGLLDNSMYGTVTGFQPPSGLTLGGSSVYNFSIGPQPMADLKPLCSQQWKVSKVHLTCACLWAWDIDVVCIASYCQHTHDDAIHMCVPLASVCIGTT
jgi:hypothetical protein